MKRDCRQLLQGADQLGGDPLAAYRQASSLLLAEFRQPGVHRPQPVRPATARLR
jgi:hypothetical protein